MALSDYITAKPVIETERLILRPITSSDVPALSQWLGDKELYTYWGKGPSKAEKDPKLLFEKQERPTKSFHLGIATKENNLVIGDIYVYLIQNDRMANVAIRIGRPYQSNGYGTESLRAITRFCFTHTELKRLQAEVDIRNNASWQMMEKCGYTREGMIRQGKLVNTWCDYYIYAILSENLL